MAWNCINCESANDFNVTICDVCGTERYFSISEVNELLRMQDLSPTEIKKIQTNFKKTSTENKKLRQNNKELAQKMQDLQNFYDTHATQVETLTEHVQFLQKTNFRWRTALVITGLIALFFVLARVTVHIQF
jgi:DNA-binding transcriptional MerR regulator